MTAIEVYKIVYDTIKSALKNGTGNQVPGHRTFAALLPPPDSISEEDARILCAMVVGSCCNDWGLEAFFQIPLNGKETLGAFVRNNITPVYDRAIQEPVAKKFAPLLVKKIAPQPIKKNVP